MKWSGTTGHAILPLACSSVCTKGQGLVQKWGHMLAKSVKLPASVVVNPTLIVAVSTETADVKFHARPSSSAASVQFLQRTCSLITRCFRF